MRESTLDTILNDLETSLTEALSYIDAFKSDPGDSSNGSPDYLSEAEDRIDEALHELLEAREILERINREIGDI